MADRTQKQEENVAGRCYVDHNCIAAKFCVGSAPEHFRMSEDGGHAYVYRQPETPEEEARCREALEGCPVEAVGDDGDE